MRVLVISAEFPPMIGGVGTFADNIARGLARAGSRVRVLTSVGVRGEDSAREVPVSRTPPVLNRKGLKIAPLILAGAWWCLRERPDWLLATTCAHEGIAAYVLRRLAGIGYGVVAHGSEILQSRSNTFRHKAIVRVLEASGIVVANSEYTRGLVLGLGIDPARVTVINPPIDVEQYPPPAGTAEIDRQFDLCGKQVILTAGRLVKRKGHAEVIKALSTLRTRYPDLAYVMTGNGEYRRELEALAREYGVADRVRMIGYVSERQIRQLYHRADVYVSPSKEDQGDIEGFGIALIEAGVCGTPVIAGGSGGVPDAVVDGETGFLVDPESHEHIVEKLLLLLGDGDLRRRLGGNARERVARDFGLERQGTRLRDRLELALVTPGIQQKLNDNA